MAGVTSPLCKKPTILKLQTMKGVDGNALNIIKRIAGAGPNYDLFGALLLSDPEQVEVNVIKMQYKSDGPETVIKEFAQKWLTKGGPTCTYEHFIYCVKEYGLGDLAELIHDKVVKEGGPTGGSCAGSSTTKESPSVPDGSSKTFSRKNVATDGANSENDEKETVELDKKQKLTEKPDLNDVMNVVAAKIPGEWEMVGGQLGISKRELDGIAKERRGNSIECWREVIVMWRNKASAKYPYLWSTIIDALNEVGEKELAEEYCTELQELHKQNTDYADKGDVKITVSDHNNVTRKVGVKAKGNWKALGSELGLSIAELNGIETQRRSGTQHCISDAIDKWRASKSKEPVTWETLLVSLCKPQVGLKYLADDIYADPKFPFK